MGTSTVSGPFRSENGFQELVNGQWVPVAGGGGGGGGFVPVALVGEYGSYVGMSDNRYSANGTQDPPTGPTAGNIIQLPPIQVGGTYYIYNPAGGSTYDTWALKLPAVPGVDLTAFASSRFAINYGIPTSGSFPVYTIGPDSYGYSNVYGPTDTMYFYGSLASTSWLGITFAAISVVPGFGTVAFFTQSNTPVMNQYAPFPDPAFYPYTQLIGS